jgi:hypothetical protein
MQSKSLRVDVRAFAATPQIWAPTAPLPKTQVDGQELSINYATSFSTELANLCPTTKASYIRTNLASPSCRKQVWAITPMPSTTATTYTLDTCDYSAGSEFDTMVAVFQCTKLTADTVSQCTCWAVDDGCTSKWGSKVASIGKTTDTSKGYFSVVLPYDCTVTTSGKYKMKLA